MKSFCRFQLETDYAIDQAILDQSYRIIILKFKKGLNFKESKFNKKLLRLKETGKENFKFYFINSEKVKEFNLMYEIKNTISSIYFFNNRKVSIDSGTGDNNKVGKITENYKKLYKITKRSFKNCLKGKNFYQI